MNAHAGFILANGTSDIQTITTMEEVVKVELIENETSARQSGCNFEVLSSIEELNSYIKAQEEATLSKFIVYNKDKTFGNDRMWCKLPVFVACQMMGLR